MFVAQSGNRQGRSGLATAMRWCAIALALHACAACYGATLVNLGSTWRYKKGTAEASTPVDAWRAVAYDHSAWPTGAAPFWYGDGTGGTQLTDMQGGYSCVFMRQTFTVANPSTVAALKFDYNYDDGFIVWINGTQVLTVNAPATVTYNALASGSHESGTVETTTLTNPQAYLLTDTNVIAVQAFNQSLGGSSDFHINVALATIDVAVNDNFGGSITLSGALPVSTTGSNYQASAEAGEPAHAGSAAAASVWWTWTPTVSERVQISTAGSSFNTRLAVYTGSAVSALTAVASNDDAGGGLTTSQVSFLAAAGTVYRIAVDGTSGATGNVSLSIARSNDNFADGQLLNGTLPVSATGSNAGATAEAGEPAHAGAPAAASVWWQWTAAASGNVMVTTASSSFDTRLAVYTGASVAALTLVAGNDDASSSVLTSQTIFVATAGTTYHIAVDGYAGATGSITLALAVAPVVSVTANDPAAAEGGNTGQFTISRVGNTSAALTVYFDVSGSADDYADYTTIGTSTTLNAGVASRTITITPLDDALYEGDETVVLTLVENAAYMVNQAGNTATVTLADNEPGVSGKVADTQFVPKRGFYSAPFSLSITTATPGATIRYTLDGTPPSSTAGTIYTAPVSVGATCMVRAMAYKTGMEPTNVDTHTYIFVDDVAAQTHIHTGAGPAGWPTAGNPNSQGFSMNYGMDPDIVGVAPYNATIRTDLTALPSFSIVMKLYDLFDSSTGIWARPQEDGRDWERPCSLELLHPDGSAGFQVDAGIRIRGGYSRSTGNPKHGLRLLFRSEYGDVKLSYPLFGPSPAASNFDAFDLRTFQNYSWSFGGSTQGVFIRDLFSRDTQLAMGHAATRGDYYHLYINGQYWGLYNTEERAEGSFGASYFGGNKDDYDVIKVDKDASYTIYATDGNMEAWTRLWKQCKAGLASNEAYFRIFGCNADGSANPAYENLLDADNLIDYMLVIYYGGNLDAPISNFLGNNSPNNFYGMRSRVGTAGFRFMAHDSEHTLLSVNENRTGPYVAGDTLNKSNPQWFFQQCTANAEFRMKLADHIQKHFYDNGLLTPAACIARFDARKAEIDRAVVAESARWGDSKREPPCTRDQHWIAEVNRIRTSYMPSRSGVVLNQLIAKGWFSNVTAPTFSQNGGDIAPGFTLTINNPNAGGRVYYTVNGSDPRAVGGAIGPATLDGGPTSIGVILNATTTVKARVLNGSTWSPLREATFYAPQDFSALRITEIMYSPPAFGQVDGEEYEFLELKNTGATALDLSGVYCSAGVTFAFPAGVTLGPGQFIVLASNVAEFHNKYPAVTAYGQYAGKLSNGGEKITLTHANGAEILSATYNDAPPWPATADGLGFSLVPVDPNLNPDPNDARNWRASAFAGGSPGADDAVPTWGTVLINEAMTHTDLPDKDEIELYNPSGNAVNVGGWYLTDDRGTPRKYRIADGTVLGAGQFVVYTETQFNPNPGVAPSFSLSSQGESVYLFAADGAGNMTGYSHGFNFGAQASGVSFGRHVISTGEAHFVAQISRTSGAVNSGPRVGPVVITEVMYNPAPGGDEFVELMNITGAPVPLYDTANPGNTWKIKGLGYQFAAGLTIPAYGIVVVCNIDPATFRTKYNVSPSVMVVGPFTGVLQDSGESLEVMKPDTPDVDEFGNPVVPYVVVDAVRYNDKSPWPLEPDGNGPSLERTDPEAYGNDPANWQASTQVGGTPGEVQTLLPASPASLSAVALIGGQIQLNWTDRANNEDGFIVERSPDGVSGWASIATLGPNVTSHLDTGLAYSTTYYYRVRAYNVYGSSPYSNTASANTAAEPPPAAPSDLSATPVSTTRIDLAWLDNSANEDGFKVQSSPDGVNEWVEIGTAAADATTFQDMPLAPATTYFYRVCAFNVSGNSAFSEITSAATLTPPPPADPTGLTATAFSNTEMDLAWTDASGDESGFTLQRSPDGVANWTEIASLPSNAQEWHDSGLTINTAYYYRVRAFHVYGASGWAAASGTTMNLVPPVDPTGLIATELSISEIGLTWTDNAAAPNNENGYKVERSNNGVGDWAEIAALPADTTSYTDSGLAYSSQYFYRVVAYNTGGASGYSNVADATTLTPPPPAQPTNLEATPFSPFRVDLAWTDASTDEIAFTIERSLTGTGGWSVLATLQADSGAYQDDTVQPRTVYYYRVTAFNDFGSSAPSDAASATTPNVPAPAQPTALTATALSATRVDLAWTDNAGDETGYKVQRSLDGASGWTVIATLPADARSHRDMNLLPLTAYYYRVYAYHAYDSSAFSNTATATTAAQDLTKLQITEIMYNPPTLGQVDGDEYEFIELKNTGEDVLYLEGVQFVAGISFVFPAGTRLVPGAFVVLASNPAEFRAKYPGVSVGGAYTGRLSDGGEPLTLADAGGTPIVSFSYGDAVPWALTPDGLGFSLVPVNFLGNPDPSNPVNWRASANAGGSPGADDPVVPPIVPVIINELLTHTDAPQQDSIELYNPGSAALDVSGWYLTDDKTVPGKYAIPAGTVIPARGYVTLTHSQFGAAFALSEFGEDAYLFSAGATGNLTGYGHGVTFGAADNGVSFGRYTISTGENHYPAQIRTTLGAANSGPRVGPVVINEIMYFPVAGGDEFVELRNITSNPVKLYDPAHPQNTWKLSGAGFIFPQNVEIPAGGLIVVSPLEPAAFRTKHNLPESVVVLGPYAGNLQDNGEMLSLEKPGAPDISPDTGLPIQPYIVVDAVRYNDKAPWPVAPAGTGPSLERIDAAAYGNDPINWRAGTLSGGTPGRLDANYPAAPTNLTAQGVSASAIALAWTDNSPSETAVMVERSADGISGWAVIATLGTNATTYQDTGLAVAATWYYRVYAQNASGPSGYSNLATAATGSGGGVVTDSDGDGYSDAEEAQLGTDPQNPQSKPGGSADFDGDGIADDQDSDADNDGVSSLDEIAAGTDPFDAASRVTIPMQVLKLQCQARFDFPGKDAASIAGIIPNLAPLFEAGGKSLLLDIGGNTVVFTLDEKGRGKNTQGSVMLKLKPAKRNKTTKKLEFQGGPVAFSAKVRNVDWADEWLDDGFEPGADAKKVPQDMAVELWLDGKVYTATVTGSYTAKAEKGGRLKK